MENIEKCECCIGVLNDYEDTKIVTLSELKEHIEYNSVFKFWIFQDHCDKRKSTDLTRFNYCPLCGKKIDWKEIKGGANG